MNQVCVFIFFCSSKNPEEAELEDTLNQVVRFTTVFLSYNRLALIPNNQDVIRNENFTTEQQW